MLCCALLWLYIDWFSHIHLTIAPVPAKQPWWIWINTSCQFIMNDYITTTKQSTTKQCAYFLGYTVPLLHQWEVECRDPQKISNFEMQCIYGGSRVTRFERVFLRQWCTCKYLHLVSWTEFMLHNTDTLRKWYIIVIGNVYMDGNGRYNLKGCYHVTDISVSIFTIG